MSDTTTDGKVNVWQVPEGPSDPRRYPQWVDAAFQKACCCTPLRWRYDHAVDQFGVWVQNRGTAGCYVAHPGDWLIQSGKTISVLSNPAGRAEASDASEPEPEKPRPLLRWVHDGAIYVAQGWEIDDTHESGSKWQAMYTVAGHGVGHMAGMRLSHHGYIAATQSVELPTLDKAKAWCEAWEANRRAEVPQPEKSRPYPRFVRIANGGTVTLAGITNAIRDFDSAGVPEAGRVFVLMHDDWERISRGILGMSMDGGIDTTWRECLPAVLWGGHAVLEGRVFGIPVYATRRTGLYATAADAEGR